MSEAVLLDSPHGLSLMALQEAINEQYNLQFTAEEIQTAIVKKGNHSITFSNDLFSLKPSSRIKLENKSSFQDELNDSITEYISTHSCSFSSAQVSTLLLNYLYYCFNSNVNNLLSLLNKNEVRIDTQELKMSNLEIAVLNDFITWPNQKKDSLIYSIISTCYEYCMLTTKKDNLLSKELFKGKRFYLDANIIFRMAGINNEERKAVTTSFIEHCTDAGIQLFCTSETLDEIYRVINSQVGFIRSIAGDGIPVSCSVLEQINPSLEINDFYKIYYNWCQQPENRSGDYISFNRFLLKLIQETISELEIFQSTAFKLGRGAADYDSKAENLRNYKNTKRKWRVTSKSSAETDLTNILDISNLRKSNSNSIWQTNDFLVSADQLLISWANEVFSGVPIVVLPSVWLSIILRFTGRTDDDYSSFCLFLTQRQHAEQEEIVDSFRLLSCVNARTNQTELKEQIIVEITQNKEQYKFDSDEDYDKSIDYAFDKVLREVYGKNNQQIAELKNDLQSQLNAQKKESEDTLREQSKLSEESGRLKAITLLSKNQAYSKVKWFRKNRIPKWISYLAAGLLLGFGLIIWLFELPPLFKLLVDVLPTKLTENVELLSLAWAVFSAAVGLVIKGIEYLFAFLGSPAREKKLYEIFYRKNMKAIKDQQ